MKAILFLFLSAIPPKVASAEALCSSLNHCEVRKISWQKGSWKKLASMELSFEKLCEGERPHMKLEKDLGVELWVFPGSKGKVGFQTRPHAQVNLHTHKLTYVVASASVPLDASSLVLTHRLRPNGNELVEVTCNKQ